MTRNEAARLLTRLYLQPCTVERFITETYGELLSLYYQGERTFKTCHAAAQAERLRRAARMVSKQEKETR